MCVSKFPLRISLGVLVVLLELSVSSLARSANEDFDYYDYDEFDPNWVSDYNPFDKPPCPDWNPVDGCGRTPARTKPASTTATPYEQTTPTPQAHTTRFRGGGRQECTQEEIQSAACLHGGECFALDLLETRSPYCQCMEMWRGPRCEEMDADIYVITADKVEKASIAAGVVVLIIVISVVIVYLVVRKRKQRKNRAQSNGNANGHAGKALMGSEKEPMDGEEAEKCTDV